MRNQLRKWVFGVLLVAGVSLAPSAFARSHVSVGLGINLPGVSIGVSNWGHGHVYGGYGWAGNYVYPAAYPAYYGGYYAPAYYSSYAYPVYDGPRYYGGGYYYRDRPVVHHTYYRDRGDYGPRSHYYDRDGYYRR